MILKMTPSSHVRAGPPAVGAPAHKIAIRTAPNSTAHAHQSPSAPSSAIAALACARFAQAHCGSPMLATTS